MLSEFQTIEAPILSVFISIYIKIGQVARKRKKEVLIIEEPLFEIGNH
jgi:hypothetical protein